ncbi:M15 family metallopeptidase [Tritonibacter mobilis]|uniref:M15 family metallopeptidase n=1 Tax=Tritonibacter mobilis TaxID=379347 RepID=UPI0003271F48|nr:M15 family metallopeptidase [Tritonibacter mobilis]KJZ22270.1 bacteriophage P7 related protein [Tritonibacter mobilis]
MYKLGTRSRNNLIGVAPDLQRVVELAITITDQDFTVVEGVRSLDRQKRLYASGASTTMNSRHLTGHAVDMIPYPFHGDFDGDGVPNIEDWDQYYPIATAMKTAALQLGIEIEWGGDWKSFKDGPHWQLPW